MLSGVVVITNTTFVQATAFVPLPPELLNPPPPPTTGGHGDYPALPGGRRKSIKPIWDRPRESPRPGPEPAPHVPPPGPAPAPRDAPTAPPVDTQGRSPPTTVSAAPIMEPAKPRAKPTGPRAITWAEQRALIHMIAAMLDEEDED